MLRVVQGVGTEARRMCPTSTASPIRETAEPTSRGVEGCPLPVELSEEAGAVLLRVARNVVAAVASGHLPTTEPGSLLPSDPPAEILVPSGAFVTLHVRGELRGCMGFLGRDRPLWETVVSAAVGAAAGDPRFLPIAASEVPALSIDVSVLGDPMPLHDLEAFRPGVDGVIVERGGRRGLLLPEVAADQGWGVHEMLAATCWKAGLPGDAWQDPRTRVLVFRTARVSDLERS
jgi:AmmeMemoRadiSam system protein A